MRAYPTGLVNQIVLFAQCYTGIVVAIAWHPVDHLYRSISATSCAFFDSGGNYDAFFDFNE